MKYYIHKIEKGRGRCVLEIEAETIAAAVAYIEKHFKTAGNYYIISADGYDGQHHTINRAGSDTATRKTLDRYTVKIKRLGRWFTVYDGFNPETASRTHDKFKFWWIYHSTPADDVKMIKKRIPRQPWHK